MKLRVALLAAAALALAGCATLPDQPNVAGRSKGTVSVAGLTFRDLDGDGRLTPYEDWRLAPEARADDLVARMTLEEKAGTLLHATLPGLGGPEKRFNPEEYDLAAAGDLIGTRKITSFITRMAIAPAAFAAQNNAVQAIAEGTRLGIPLTISSDPRHHFQYVAGASVRGDGFTQWPESTGFAALRDAALVRRFGQIAAREYRAVGLHQALSPQVDLATEPRWPRMAGTFGSDPDLASELGGAYVAGFQGGTQGLQPGGVLTVVKHWVGYGAQPEGFDAHNHYGRFADLDDRSFARHVRAFDGALAARAGGVMPAYPILRGVSYRGEPLEQVGPGYSKQLLDGLLRDDKGYQGIILSDWAITADCPEQCRAPTAAAPQAPQFIATSWGVEGLTVAQRYAKGIDAGIDQFGGTEDVAPIVEAVRRGLLGEARIDRSVRRILIAKFQLGLFENPYVDPAAAGADIGRAADVALAERTQREAQVLLKDDAKLPLGRPGARVWLVGMDPAAATRAGLIPVESPDQADFALIRAETPSELLHPHHFFGRMQKEGRLDFRPGDPAFDALVRAREAGKPSVLSLFLDRPAVLTGVMDKADVILANFGADDAAVLDVVLGKARARGRLPFELPSSMAAVEAQHPALPHDSAAPLFGYGAGIVD
ncbi:glycoside hydrolase family 3 protein [Tsuneonella sp. HG222]